MQQLPYSALPSGTWLGKSVFRRIGSPLWEQKSIFIGENGILNREDAILRIIESARNEGYLGYMLCPPIGKEVRIYVYK